MTATDTNPAEVQIGRDGLPPWLTEMLLDLLVDEVTRRFVGWNCRPEGPEAMPDIESDILDHVARRDITRLVHFTRAESLKEIIQDQEIASIWRLRCRNRTVATNDLKRLDGHLDYVCCSVEYPNVYVLDRYSEENPDRQWVVLFLHPVLLGLPTTKDTARN